MTSLPYIDEHSTEVAAPVDSVWSAIGRTMGHQSALPARALAAVLGTDPRSTHGAPLTPGSTIPGFRVGAAVPGERVVFAGRHRFAEYELVFEVADLGDRTRVTALSYARFPGLHGRIYRAMVVGSGGHRAAVRRMLGGIAQVAEDAAR